MPRAQALELGREALRKHAWAAAYLHLSAAESQAPLHPIDLEGLAMATHLLGKEAETEEILARAHQRFLAEENPERAARCAFWLAFGLLNNGELAQAGGWLARAHRLLDEGRRNCVEQGYLLVPAGIRSMRAGDAVAAYETFTHAAEIGERFRDTDLITLARHGQGRSLIRLGETVRGVSLLDETMVAVTADEVSCMVIGGIYCSVIEACGEMFDLRRAQEWTSALERWCASQPDHVPYRGHCLVRRAEILQLHGAWPDALDEAQQACQRLSQPTPKPALGAAYYQVAEVHRLRGEFSEAEEAYRLASRWEKTPQPGFALLRLAQGQVDAACAAIRHVADQVRDPAARPRLLDAYVEIMLAAEEVVAARAASEELAEIETHLRAPLLGALSARATGAVLFVEHNSKEALLWLRQALTAWLELEAPYEVARLRVWIARACRAQGNADLADLELEAARTVFEQLGAAPDLARVHALLGQTAEAEGPLTGREVQVLRLVASGMTNREMADRLGISEKTVARHLSNIFTKLDLSSRAAATAYAYQNGLAGPPST